MEDHTLAEGRRGSLLAFAATKISTRSSTRQLSLRLYNPDRSFNCFFDSLMAFQRISSSFSTLADERRRIVGSDISSFCFASFDLTEIFMTQIEV